MFTFNRALVLATMVVLAAPLPAVAAFQNGNDLLRACQSEGVSYGVCLGYIEAVGDSFNEVGGVCLPVGTEAGQVKEIVVKYLTENVTSRQNEASGLVYQALEKAWPCPKKGKAAQ